MWLPGESLTRSAFLLLAVQLATIRSQLCDVASSVKLSPIDSSVPFRTEAFPEFDLSDMHKKSPVKVYHKSNIVVELSDKSSGDKSPTLSGGGFCQNGTGSEPDQTGTDGFVPDCVFKFEKLVFNWKSEEQANPGKEFPMETHFLFFNQT